VDSRLYSVLDLSSMIDPLPTVSKSGCLGRTNGSIVLSHLVKVPNGFSVFVLY